jgi:hypothetical protein
LLSSLVLPAVWALDGLFNIVKEFWPDINHAIFHGKY